MGNTRSEQLEYNANDLWWEQRNLNSIHVNEDNACKVHSTFHEKNSAEEHNEHTNDDKLDEFRQELARKRDKRREIMAEKRKEMQDLRDELIAQKRENEELRRLLNQKNLSKETADICLENSKLEQEITELKEKLLQTEAVGDKNRELRTSVAELQKELQSVNAEIVSFEKERLEYQLHVTALKDVIKVSKQMLQLREGQIKELRDKVTEIEASLAGREMHVLSQDLREEYERQLRNIRSLRILYEERQRADKREKEELTKQLETAKRDLDDQRTKSTELENRIVELESDNSKKYDTINTLQSNLGLAKAGCRELEAEMAVINQLFSHILLEFKNCQDIDLDRLIKLLEENHDLLQTIVINDDSKTSSALPKVLLDLVTQMNDKEKSGEKSSENETSNHSEKLETIAEETESQTASYNLNSPEQIVENLPKVWKVLIELLSHQNPPVNILTEDKLENSDDPCYKVVQTPKGQRAVLSVSQTFIRLKNLILEKKSLEKETTHLKQLNGHLEVRLQDQEKRLELVSNELTKTWHVVGKMQKQHQQLHTQEKILRYELAQKRKMLTELKEELEYCREKWLQAREKNTSTEAQWKELRTEFASRKVALNDDLNNSVESGYSDEPGCSTDEEEEPGYETDISECHNKASSPETVPEDIINIETSEEDVSINENACAENDNTIVDVIRPEIQEIVALPPESENTVESEQPCESTSGTRRDSEAIAAAREKRLKRLEQEAQQLMAKVTNTTDKSVKICAKLENLHEIYGESSNNGTRNEESDDTDSITQHLKRSGNETDRNE